MCRLNGLNYFMIAAILAGLGLSIIFGMMLYVSKNLILRYLCSFLLLPSNNLFLILSFYFLTKPFYIS
jgi:hypothetical protein